MDMQTGKVEGPRVTRAGAEQGPGTLAAAEGVLRLGQGASSLQLPLPQGGFRSG